MVDNVTADAGTGGAVFATDDIGGVHYPINKLTFGALDAQTIASSGTGTDDAGTQRVTLATDIPLPTGPVTNAGTFTVQEDGAALTALQLLDNTVYSEDVATPATIVGNAVVMERDDALGALTPIEGDWAALRCDANGALWTSVDNTVTVDGSGVTQPVSGTVTANLSATDNAVLDAIVAAQLPDGHNVTVDNASLTVDLGANNDVTVTSGTVTANLGATDNAVLDTIATNTGASLTDTELRAAAVVVDLGANNDVTVTSGTIDLGATDNAVLDTIATNTGAAIATGSNTIGEVTIGTATTAATDLGKAIDAAAGASDVGIAALAVRDDALTTLTPVDGDYVPLRVGSTGALHVTGGGGGTEYTEDVASPNPIVGTATMMERDDALSTLTPVEGDWAGMRCDSQGALWVNAVNADGTSAIDTASGGTDTGAVMLAIRDDALTTLTPVDGDYVALRTNSTGALHVTGGGGGTEYTQDAAATDPATAATSLLVRDDALTTQETTDGDWTVPRANARGAQWVEIDPTNALDVSAATVTVDLGANNDVTVTSGTVTANLGATDNAVLDSIQTAVEVIDDSVLADDAAFTLTTSSVNMAGAIRDDALTTLTAVEGDAVPLRVGSTGALHVTGGGGGTEYSIDDAAPTVVSMAGTIRDDTLTTLTEADGDASTLRVNSTGALHVTGGGGGTEYTEDDAAPANPIGTASLMERDDALGGLTPIAGDWSHMFCSANGALWTSVDGTVTVDGSGVTQPVSGTVTANPASGTIDTVTNLAQMGAAAISMNTGVRDAGTQRVTIATNDSVPVTGTVTANPASGTIDTVTNLAQMGGAALAMNTGVRDAGTQRVTIATNDVVPVTGTVTAVTDITNTIDSTISGNALTALQLIDNPIVAHDAAVSGSTGVDMAGARATNSVEGITQVANADATRVQADLNGVLITRNGTTLEEIVSERVSNTNGTSTDLTTFAAGGAGIHAYITSVTIHNSHATTMGYVDLRNGAAGAVVWTFPAPATGGTTHNFDPPLKFAANTAVAYDVSAAITTMYISLNGYFAQG